MEYRLKFVWLGKLSLLALALMLASDLLMWCSFPMHLYAMYQGLALCLVIPYAISRIRRARSEDRRALPHVYRLLICTSTGFILCLAWSIAYFNYEGAFQGLDLGLNMDLLGPRMLRVFISNYAVKAVVLPLTLVCLADAFQRGKGSGGKPDPCEIPEPPEAEEPETEQD